MILIDAGMLGTSAYGNRDAMICYFKGDVPQSMEEIPFEPSIFDNILFHPDLVAMTQVKQSYDNTGKYTGNDGAVISQESTGVGQSWIPFNHVENLGNSEYRYVPKDIKFKTLMSGEEPVTYGNFESDGVEESLNLNNLSHCNMNPYIHGYLVGSQYYSSIYPPVRNAADYEVGDYFEITLGQRIALKRTVHTGYTGGTSSYHRPYYDVMGWDYDTGEWVNLGKLEGYQDTFTEFNATLVTDKYRFVVYKKSNYYPILSRLDLISDTEPTANAEQPTWVAILPRITNAVTTVESIPFIWASCSGPSGNSEFKLSKDQFAPCDYVALLTTRYAYEPFWEEV